MRVTQCLALAVMVGCMPAAAWAKDQQKAIKTTPASRSWVTFEKRKQQSPWKKRTGWGRQAQGKLAFGARNTLLGWTEVVTEPYAAAQHGRSVAGGLVKGLWNGLADTLGGAAHLVTFPITSLDVPLPQGGVQL